MKNNRINYLAKTIQKKQKELKALKDIREDYQFLLSFVNKSLSKIGEEKLKKSQIYKSNRGMTENLSIF